MDNLTFCKLHTSDKHFFLNTAGKISREVSGYITQAPEEQGTTAADIKEILVENVKSSGKN